MCEAERLTPRTSNLKVQRSRLALRVVSLDKELYSPLSLFTQVYAYRRHIRDFKIQRRDDNENVV